MRGKRVAGPCSKRRSGNIPAYAGKTPVPEGIVSVAAEHPRVCGENLALELFQVLDGGTSPRMRGKPVLCSVGAVSTRNIPAYAGKTYCDMGVCLF